MPFDAVPSGHSTQPREHTVPAGPKPSIDFRAIFRGVWRRHKLLTIVIFFVVAIPLFGFVYLSAKPEYVASATIVIETSVLEQLPLFRDMPRRENVAAHLALLRSRALAEAVVEALPTESRDELLTHSQYQDYMLNATNFVKRMLNKPITVPSVHDRAVAEVQHARMEFSQSRQSPSIVTLRGSASNPRVAMDLVNTTLQVLMTRTRDSNQDDALRARQFLERQLQQARESQRSAEEALARFEARNNRVRGPQTDSSVARLAQLESSLAEAQTNREVASTRIAALRESVERDRAREARAAIENAPAGRDDRGRAAGTAANAAALRTAQERLTAVEQRLATLRERYTDAHPSVQLAVDEVTRQRTRVAQLAREIAASTPPAEAAGAPAASAAPSNVPLAERVQQLAALENEEASLRARVQALTLQVERLRGSLRNVNQDEIGYSNLQRAVETNRNLAATLSERLMTARMREQGDANAFRTLDPASLPTEPSRSPQRMFLLILGLSTALAFGTSITVELWRQPVETEADIAKATDLALLGSVGVIDTPREWMHRRKLAQPIALFHRNKTIHMELYRSIRANVETQRLKAPFRSILITSAGPHEGKSTTVMNLAHVFQEFGRRVLVVEADLRRPSLYSTLGLTNRPGIVDYLSGTATFEQVCRPLASGVTVIPGQVARGDSASLLASSRFKDLLKATASQFDLVLFDTAPMLAVPDNLLLLHSVDRAILVARATTTSARDLRKAQKTVENAGGQLLGVILNGAHPHDVPYYHPRYRRYYAPADTNGAKEGAQSRGTTAATRKP